MQSSYIPGVPHTVSRTSQCPCMYLLPTVSSAITPHGVQSLPTAAHQKSLDIFEKLMSSVTLPQTGPPLVTLSIIYYVLLITHRHSYQAVRTYVDANNVFSAVCLSHVSMLRDTKQFPLIL